jgi:hypothetical protein
MSIRPVRGKFCMVIEVVELLIEMDDGVDGILQPHAYA